MKELSVFQPGEQRVRARMIIGVVAVVGVLAWGCESPTRPEPPPLVLTVEAAQDTAAKRIGLRISVGDSLLHAAWCRCETITVVIDGLE